MSGPETEFGDYAERGSKESIGSEVEDGARDPCVVRGGDAVTSGCI